MLEFEIDKALKLRIVSPDLTETAHALVMENFERLHSWMIWANESTTIESTRNFFLNCEKEFEEKTALNFGIFFEDELIGITSLFKIDSLNKSVEIGYWIGEKFEGYGIVTKTCKALIEYAFGELEVNTVRILCATENRKSRAIPERLGFVQEGILREAQWMHDHFQDLVVYSMLKNEWRNELRVKS